MAWFTDTTSAPKIVTEVAGREEGVSFTTDTGLLGKTRTVTESTTEWLGLTYAAADSIATSKNSDTNTSAKAVRMNAAGMYKVVATVRTTTAWA